MPAQELMTETEIINNQADSKTDYLEHSESIGLPSCMFVI